MRRDNWRKKYLNQIICGDCYEILGNIPSESIELTITSPPYFQQREYENGGIGNENSVEEYVDNLLKVVKELARVTTKQGAIVFNVGDKYENSNLLLAPYRFAIKVIEETDLKLVNNLMWIKTNPTPRQYKKRLVSSHEPFFIFTKTNNYTFNLSDFQKEKKSLPRQRPRTAIGRRYYQLIEQSSLSDKEKQAAKEELSKTIQEVEAGKIQSFRMKIRGIHKLPFGGQEGGRLSHIKKNGFTIIKIHGNSLKKDYMLNSVEGLKWDKHPAIFPKSLVKEAILLLTNKGNIVLDPFVGSGTTAVAAVETGRDYIGIDISPYYCEKAQERISDFIIKNNRLPFENHE